MRILRFLPPPFLRSMTQQLILELIPAPPPTLDNFIVGRNAAAVDAIKHCGNGRAVYLWGPDGAGRSHLLQARCGAVTDAIYVHPSNAQSLLERILNDEITFPKLVAVDDVNHLDDETQGQLFALYNLWRASAASPNAFALIVSGSFSPQAMPIREDLRTRLGWDLVFRLEHLSDQDRAQALNNQARERGLQLAPEVVNWLLTHYTRDMSRLITLINNLDHYSLEKQRGITLPLLREFLAQREPLLARQQHD
jgi:DnaA family protein